MKPPRSLSRAQTARASLPMVFMAALSMTAPVACARGPAQSTTAASQSASEVKRVLLEQRQLPDMPGLESRLYLIEFPPGAAAKLHKHPVQCVGYVLEGSFESAFGDGSTTIKRQGEGFVDLAHEPHRFRNPDPVRRLRFVIAGTFHQNEPLFLPL